MVIEHAERFGLAQLHQLRGRVGRSEKASRCILLYHEPLGERGEGPHQHAARHQRRFRHRRGGPQAARAGDVLGTRQTGLPDFRLVDLGQHLPLIRVAHDDARHVLQQDPDLLSERGKALRLLLGLFEYDAAMARLKGV